MPGEAAESSGAGSGWDAGCSSAGSAGDGEPAEPMLLDPGNEMLGLVE